MCNKIKENESVHGHVLHMEYEKCDGFYLNF
jgi:hypothetical protein